MAEKEDTAIIVTTLVEGNVAASGAVTGLCPDCGQPIWISLSSQEFMKKKPGTLIFCNDCAIRFIEKHGPLRRFGGFVPGSFKEAQNYFRERNWDR